jgi:hypothetical protein
VSDLTNDIDALLAALDWGPGALTNEEMLDRSHAALTALVAERNRLKAQCDKALRFQDVREPRRGAGRAEAALAELEALSKPVYISHGQRVESIDLRERLVCAALTGLLSNSAFNALEDATALAAMRKGEA